MSPAWKDIIWRQFGAAIETLENALRACPDELWHARVYHESTSPPTFGEFWYIGYHAIFWIDYYCSDSAEEFRPPAPFTTSELQMDEVPPVREYTRQELITYLDYARNKCHAKIEALADENEPQRVRPNWRVKTVGELLLYTMRHTQEHAAELNLLLGQKTGSSPGWVGQVKSQS